MSEDTVAGVATYENASGGVGKSRRCLAKLNNPSARILGKSLHGKVIRRTDSRDNCKKWVRHAKYIIAAPATDAELALKVDCQPLH